MDRTSWVTGVGEVGEGRITVRGYHLEEMIRGLPFSAVVYLTIRGELPNPNQARVMDAVLSAIVEHGFYSPTTAAARIVASTSPESIVRGLTAGLLTIGSVTVSPQHSAELINEATALHREQGLSPGDAAVQVAKRLVAEQRRMPGLGHPLHPEGDPRAAALRDVARANGVWGLGADMFAHIADTYCTKIGRQLPVNIDGMLACVMNELGFEPLEMPGVAAISFMPGLIAHTVEEIESGLKLRVVDGDYTGPSPRSLPATGAYWTGRGPASASADSGTGSA